MRLLQRYVLLDLARVFTMLVSVLTVLLVFVGVAQQVSESGLGMVQVVQILPFVVPSLLPYTIPATLLLTVCLVYGRMAGDAEITAAKAAGVNVFSLIWPALLLAAALSLASLILSDRIIPWAVANIQRTVASAMEDIFLDVLRSRHKLSDPRRGYEITVTHVDGKTLINPTFQYAKAGSAPVYLQAVRGELEFDLANQQVILHLGQGTILTPSGQMLSFAEEHRPFPLPSEIAEPKPRNMPIEHIEGRIATFAREAEISRNHRDTAASMAFVLGEYELLADPAFQAHGTLLKRALTQTHRHTTEVHSRYALSASCFFFVLLGAPVAILQGRTQFLTTFLMCFLPILLAYYPVVLGMMNLSKNGSVDPLWAMWLGNAGLLLAGGYFMRRVLRY
jgi:lipopolysaccharide export system permease protein